MMKKQSWKRLYMAALAAVLAVPLKNFLLGNLTGAAFAAPASQENPKDFSVDSTVPVQKETSLSLDGGRLILAEGNEKQESSLLEQVYLADSQASESVRQIYAYLSAVGQTKGVIYGHQNDIWHKAGTRPDEKNGLTDSDTADVTGSIAGIVGIDTLSLTGDEYSAKRYNQERCSGSSDSMGRQIDIEQLGEAAANVKAAAQITNEAIEQGAIITMSCHMPNFSIVKEREDYDPERDPVYGKYDFSGYSPNVVTGDTINEILPGGKYNEPYNAYLDMIADYASQVNGAILFRPFHENTGSWFWWGEAFCDPAAYRNVYRYTVEYLRDEREIHNFLYVYSPGSEPETIEEYGIRYPGNAYVDLVGFDMYNSQPPADNSVWLKQFKERLDLVTAFAKENGKLAAVTETGMATDTPAEGDSQTALYRTGNQDSQWYQEILDLVSESEASYFLLWSNFSQTDGFYTPYVTERNQDGSLHGHELLDSFLKFYNDKRTIFAETQKDVLKLIPAAEPRQARGTASYFVIPSSGKRILGETHFWAKVSSELLSNSQKRLDVKFVFHAGEQEREILAETDGAGHYGWILSEKELLDLGAASGETDLVIDGQVCDTIKTIFNIPEPVRENWEVDNFEDYGGDVDLLAREWAVNKAAGCKVALSLSEDTGAGEGRFGLGLSYEEGPDGWAGVTTARETDWSEWNALSFYTVPDGNNQKVVVQIQAAGVTYEAYLNEYEEYQDSVSPMLVTIPFAEFCERDTAGHPKGGLTGHAGEISSFGLWVNAIQDSSQFSEGIVKGVIYYDDIRAVTAEEGHAVFQKLEGGEQKAPQPDSNLEGQETMEQAGSTKPDETLPWLPVLGVCGAAAVLLAGWNAVKKKQKRP